MSCATCSNSIPIGSRHKHCHNCHLDYFHLQKCFSCDAFYRERRSIQEGECIFESHLPACSNCKAYPVMSIPRCNLDLNIIISVYREIGGNRYVVRLPGHYLVDKYEDTDPNYQFLYTLSSSI